MSARCVRLPNGKRVGLGKYVQAWRTLKTTGLDEQIGGFGYFPESASYVLREIHLGMHGRINRHIPGFGVGRKWSDNWQNEVIRFAYFANMPRVILRCIPHDLRGRFAHRIHRPEDD